MDVVRNRFETAAVQSQKIRSLEHNGIMPRAATEIHDVTIDRYAAQDPGTEAYHWQRALDVGARLTAWAKAFDAYADVRPDVDTDSYEVRSATATIRYLSLGIVTDPPDKPMQANVSMTAYFAPPADVIRVVGTDPLAPLSISAEQLVARQNGFTRLFQHGTFGRDRQDGAPNADPPVSAIRFKVEGLSEYGHDTVIAEAAGLVVSNKCVVQDPAWPIKTALVDGLGSYRGTPLEMAVQTVAREVLGVSEGGMDVRINAATQAVMRLDTVNRLVQRARSVDQLAETTGVLNLIDTSPALQFDSGRP